VYTELWDLYTEFIYFYEIVYASATLILARFNYWLNGGAVKTEEAFKDLGVALLCTIFQSIVAVCIQSSGAYAEIIYFSAECGE